MNDGCNYVQGVSADLVFEAGGEYGALLPKICVSGQQGDLKVDATGITEKTQIDVIGEKSKGDVEIVSGDTDATVNIRNRKGDVTVATRSGADAVSALRIEGKLEVNTAEGTDLVMIDGKSNAQIDTGKDNDSDVVIVDGAHRADFDVSKNPNGNVVLTNKNNGAEISLCNVDGISFRGDGSHSEIISPAALLKDAESVKGNKIG